LYFHVLSAIAKRSGMIVKSVNLTWPRRGQQIAINEKSVGAANDKFSQEVVFGLLTYFYSFKKNAFREEKEWRLLSFFLQSNGESCDFRADMEK